MQVECNGKIYKTVYFPFFRLERKNDYQLFGLRYPSGYIDKIIISDSKHYIDELRDYLIFLIQEYILEDDDALTPYAKRLKADIYDLFDEAR